MEKRNLGRTGLSVAPIVFGGNVFGWTVDEKQSFSLLDAFVDAGFNAIDTADVYSLWADGNKGGESETIIGHWLKQNPSRRDQVLIFTKAGGDLGIPGHKGLSAKWITQAIEDSLRRLHCDTIDLYFSHCPDPGTPCEETLGAYERLLAAGKIRHIGASNFNAQQLQNALNTAGQHQLPRYDVLQPEYNLYQRGGFEHELQNLCIREEIAVITYYSLASGFLSGKYRGKDDLGQSRRSDRVTQYINDRGMRILHALDSISEKYQTKQADVALAWLMARPGVTAPIVSATRISHIDSFVRAANLKLSTEDMQFLNAASAE